jgi:hypothetical protein
MGSAIRGIMQGLPLKVLAVNQKLPLFYLVARPELKTFADLKGKTMARDDLRRQPAARRLPHAAQRRHRSCQRDHHDSIGRRPGAAQAQVSGPVQITVLSPPTSSSRATNTSSTCSHRSATTTQFHIGADRVRKKRCGKAGLIRRTLARLQKRTGIFTRTRTDSADILVQYLNVSRPIAVETYPLRMPAYTP